MAAFVPTTPPPIIVTLPGIRGNFIAWLKENNFVFNITRLDIAVDYQNGDELLPFHNRKSHFGKMTKGTILITEKFRGDFNRPSEWVQFRSTFIATFYDKTKEILTSKNKEKRNLYDEIYNTEQVFRFELKLIYLKNFMFDTDLLEKNFIQLTLSDWYETRLNHQDNHGREQNLRAESDLSDSPSKIARLRKRGMISFTKARADEYLKLLSIYQTCEYRDLSFLRFLLSGLRRL